MPRHIRRQPGPVLGLLASILVAAWVLACADPDDGTLLGTLERQRIEIVASASEPLAELTVRQGDAVEAGQVLGRLDDRRVAARVEAAEARVRRVEARIAELVRGARSERRDEALARIEADRSELAQAKLEQRRAEGLVASGVSPQSRLDEATTRVETAQARLEQDRAALDEMVSGATAEELRQARADLDAASAEVADLRVDLERMTLRAPVAGRVDAVPYAVGELPGAGATLVVLLADARPYARVYVPEPQLASTSVGTLATVGPASSGSDEEGDEEGDEQGEEQGAAALQGCVRWIAREATFTPHYALSEHDRHRLVFVAEIALRPEDVRDLPTGLPVQTVLHPEQDRCTP